MISEPTEAYAHLTQVLEEIRQKRTRGGWPICRYIADPPGKSLLQKYLQQLRQEDLRQAPATSIFYMEVPAPALQKRSETYLPTLFLKALGDPQAEARTNVESKRMRLELLMGKRDIDLIVLTNFHHFVTPAKQQPLNYEITWIKALIKDITPPIPVVVTGTLETIERILHSNEQMSNLFSYLPLPGEMGSEDQQRIAKEAPDKK